MKCKKEKIIIGLVSLLFLSIPISAYTFELKLDSTVFNVLSGITILLLIVSFAALHFFRLNKQLKAELLNIQHRQNDVSASMSVIAHRWKQPLNQLGMLMMTVEVLLARQSESENSKKIHETVLKAHDVLASMAKTIDEGINNSV